MYPLLHGLEEKGFLTSYEKEVGGKVRKYYAITDSGRKRIREFEEEWKEMQAIYQFVTMGGRHE